MMNSIEEIQALPDIDLLDDLGVSLENTIEEMIEDYEAVYEERIGREKILYAADRDRIILTVIAGQIYQVQERMAYLFKRNYLKWMEDEDLENWGANLGYKIPEAASAKVTLRFYVNDPLEFDVKIPVGTRATAGDNVFFETQEDITLPAGTSGIEVEAVCTDPGDVGNEYISGQINVVADPVPYISGVENTSVSAGGTERAEGEDLMLDILQWMSTYSTAGPSGAYEYWVMSYSDSIIDVSARSRGDDSATEDIYVLLEGGKLPDAGFLTKLGQYINDLGNFPDTDKINLQAPEEVTYDLNITYFIDKSRRDNGEELKEMIEDAIDAYVEYQGSGIGRAIDTGVLIEYVRAAGAKRVEIASPTYQKLTASQVAICKERKILYGGLEE